MNRESMEVEIDIGYASFYRAFHSLHPVKTPGKWAIIIGRLFIGIAWYRRRV